MIGDDDLIGAVARAREFAALSVEFDPLQAVTAGLGLQPSPPLAARVMGMLRADCTDAADGKRWIMRQSPRDRVLVALKDQGFADPTDLSLPGDPLALTMRGVLRAEPAQTTQQIDAVLADPTPDLAVLTTLARAVELAGQAAGEALGRLPQLRSALNRQEEICRSDQQLAGGYFGNEALRQRIGAWIDNPPDAGLARALYIGGIPGVGKSFLLTKLVQEARERSRPLVLQLDFDRRGINLVEPDSLAIELSRQLGNELPEHAAHLADLRARVSGEEVQESAKRGPGVTPWALIEAMGSMVRASQRTILLVLDTVEVLASYGETHPQRLFEALDILLKAGLGPLAIVAAGRGEALTRLGTKRIERIERLRGLPERVARAMLARLDAPAAAIPRILGLARGNPLILRLAAKLAREAGPGAIAFDQYAGEAPDVAGAYLYRAVLSRIDDPRLREVASLGLVLSRVNADVIRAVIAPALGFELSAGDAAAMLAELRTHHWLVDEEPGTGWVRHRSDVRQIILPLLYAERREQVARVNRAAADFLRPSDAAEATYHALQATGPLDPLPPVSSAAAVRFTEQMIEELADRAADAVLQARGERSRSGRTGTDPAPPVAPPRQRAAAKRAAPKPAGQPANQETALNDLRILLEKGDLIEAQRLFRSHFTEAADPTRADGLAALAHLWLSGQWAKAEWLYCRLEAAGFAHEPWKGAEALVRLVLLELRAEFGFDDLVASFEQGEDALRQAQYAYRDAKALRLFNGPLAYALLAERRLETISGGWREVIVAAGTGLHDRSVDARCLGEVQKLRERYGLPGPAPGTPGWEIAACLNPYSGPVGTLLSLRMSPLLGRYVEALRQTFTALAEVPFGVDQGVGAGQRLLSREDEAVAHLGVLGATADWLSAFAFFNQATHVPLIARRAEAWRRVAAGEWAYGANPPIDWHSPPDGIDCGAMLWLDRLRERSDPADEAARQLLYWIRPRYDKDQLKTPVELGKRVVVRLTRALDLAQRAADRAQDDPFRAALRALLAHRHGRSIAVPIAVLAVAGLDPGRQAGRWLGLLHDAIRRASAIRT